MAAAALQPASTSTPIGLQPIVAFGTEEQKQRWIVPMIEGREIDKMGRKSVDSNLLFIEGLRVPAADRLGEEGKGFRYILHGMDAEHRLVGAGTIGLGKLAREYHVERYLRESFMPRIAPVSREFILCHVAEKVLGLPKSY